MENPLKTPPLHVSRRHLLQGLGALVVAIQLPVPTTEARAAAGPTDLNAFVAIHPNGEVWIQIPASEMGQGVSTALPQILADELDADWSSVRVRHADEHKDYRGITLTPFNPRQLTGGSLSVVTWTQPMRLAGAAAREMLVVAAANRWGVEASACTTALGRVRHPDGHESAYGDLVADAAVLRVPRKPRLKSPAERTLVGTSVPRTDLVDKVTGGTEFGADVRLPGMVYACSVACPVFGGRVGEVDDGAARAISGVRDVLVFEDFVAVVADTWWPAKRAIDALKITWDEGPNARLDSNAIDEALVAGLDAKGAYVGLKIGNAARELADADDLIEATYDAPYVDHAAMEPLNCTVELTDDHCEIWVGTQGQTKVRMHAAKITGLPMDKVTVHTAFLGGGFGRRGQADYADQAVHIAMRVDAPVQLLWTREEGIRHGFYRTIAKARMRASTGETLEALSVRIACDNVNHSFVPKWTQGVKQVKVHPAEGLLHTSPYAIPNRLIEVAHVPMPVPTGYWRSVGHSYTAFFMESFLDEVAHRLGTDPVALRRSLLGEEHHRFRAVLDRVVDESGWGSAPEGRFQGIALHESFGSICAEVAEISMEDGVPRVQRVTAAVDCGEVVNPDIVRAQIMGGVVFGLSAAMGERLDIDRGRIRQANFYDYSLLRMNQSPIEVDVHIIETPGAVVGGIGEVGVPPIAPATCNAIFAATGVRIRSLPILSALRETP